MTDHVIAESMWAEKPWAGIAFFDAPPPTHAILFITTDIQLIWTGIDEASSYQLQVSLFPDFRTTFVDVSVSATTHSFIDGETDNEKRYWRVRPHNGTEYFEPWSQVGAYWLDTTAAEQLILDRNQWAIADIDDVTDIYLFEMFPTYTIVPQNLFRVQERNRLGELLSEFLTIKSQIQLMFSGSQYLEHTQFNEFRRFHNNKRTFYLYAFIDGVRARPVPHIWKVEYIDDPALTMMAAGRPDLLTGTLNLEEV